MNILIIGASKKTSIGYSVGESLKAQGHSVIYASRSGILGKKCDITNTRSVKALLTSTKPHVVILAAGLFLDSGRVGKLQDMRRIQQHLLAKSFGGLVVADTLMTIRPNAQLIVFGGRDVSGDATFAPYTIGNGALWGLVRFLNKHSKIKASYIDLPFVEGSTMEKQFNSVERHKVKRGNVAPKDIACIIAEIVGAKERRERVVLGKGAT